MSKLKNLNNVVESIKNIEILHRTKKVRIFPLETKCFHLEKLTSHMINIHMNVGKSLE